MALAWVEFSDKGGQPVFDVQTGGNRYFEMFLTTRPELMQPGFAQSRSPENFYSSRAALGKLLPSSEGRALYPLPEILGERFRNGKIYFMVKTFADPVGNGPAVSPLMESRESVPVTTGVDPTEATIMVDQESVEVLSQSATRASQRSGATSWQASRRTDGNRTLTVATSAHSQNAAGLALFCRALQAACVADPQMGNPNFREVARLVSHVLPHVPAATVAVSGNGFVSAASAIGAQIGIPPTRATPSVMERAIVRANERIGRQPEYSRAQWAWLATLVPYIIQYGPMIIELLGKLFAQKGQAGTAKSLAGGAETAAGGMPAGQPGIEAVLQLLMSLPPEQRAKLLQAAAGSGGATQTAPAAAPQAPVPGTVGGSPVSVPPATTTPPGGGGQMSPDQLAGLFGALQGAGGGGGGGFALPAAPGGPGSEMLKSIVDRLPIQKMFDATVWAPDIKHDQFIQTLPWNEILSLSRASSTVGALLIPGRKDLRPLRGIKVAVVNRSLTPLDGDNESWIFLADRPARIHLEVTAGPEGLERPFVDVRISQDGTAATGIARSVFRLQSLAPHERRVVDVEVPAEVLSRAPSDGKKTCVSIRVIEYSGSSYRGAETRVQFYAVPSHAIVLEPGAGLRDAPELEFIPGLQRRIPDAAIAPEPRTVDWIVQVVPRQHLPANGRYLPLTQRVVDGEVVLAGGLTLSSLGLADLARRGGQTFGAEGLHALSAAIDSSAALRERMNLRVREMLEPGSMKQGTAVRVEMGWLPAFLVSFGGGTPEGNPMRRQVSKVNVPAPRGIRIQAA